MLSDIADLIEAQIVSASKKVDYYTTEYTIEYLTRKLTQDCDEFARHIAALKVTWSIEQQSKFIESIIIGLPLQHILILNNKHQSHVVDGTQRLLAINEFINNSLLLTGLDVLTMMNGCSFNDLPKSRQRRVKNRTIRGIVFSDKTTDETLEYLLSRINTSNTYDAMCSDTQSMESLQFHTKVKIKKQIV